jgi:DNA-binding GntR family transcriptional regulator
VSPLSESGPVDFRGLADEVAGRLRAAILDGRLQDGERIVERDLAEQLGVSRGPIRDALKLLEHEGLVVLLPRRGASVATLTAEDAAEVLQIRAALEPIAVEELLRREDPQLLAPLKTCLEQLRAASEAGDWSGLVSLDMEFHELVFRQSGRPRLLRIWESLRIPLLQTFRVHREFFDSGATIYERHAALYVELARGDVERATAATRKHVLDLRPQLFERLTRGE